MKPRLCLLACCALLTLTSCVDRQQADAKLTKGCRAGVNALLDDQKIDKVTKVESTPSPEGNDIKLYTQARIMMQEPLVFSP